MNTKTERETKRITLTIDDQQVTVETGASALEAVNLDKRLKFTVQDGTFTHRRKSEKFQRDRLRLYRGDSSQRSNTLPKMRLRNRRWHGCIRTYEKKETIGIRNYR